MNGRLFDLLEATGGMSIPLARDYGTVQNLRRREGPPPGPFPAPLLAPEEGPPPTVRQRAVCATIGAACPRRSVARPLAFGGT